MVVAFFLQEELLFEIRRRFTASKMMKKGLLHKGPLLNDYCKIAVTKDHLFYRNCLITKFLIRPISPSLLYQSGKFRFKQCAFVSSLGETAVDSFTSVYRAAALATSSTGNFYYRQSAPDNSVLFALRQLLVI